MKLNRRRLLWLCDVITQSVISGRDVENDQRRSKIERQALDWLASIGDGLQLFYLHGPKGIIMGEYNDELVVAFDPTLIRRSIVTKRWRREAPAPCEPGYLAIPKDDGTEDTDVDFYITTDPARAVTSEELDAWRVKR